jgi:hypothetical protein
MDGKPIRILKNLLVQLEDEKWERQDKEDENEDWTSSK